MGQTVITVNHPMGNVHAKTTLPAIFANVVRMVFTDPNVCLANVTQLVRQMMFVIWFLDNVSVGRDLMEFIVIDAKMVISTTQNALVSIMNAAVLFFVITHRYFIQKTRLNRYFSNLA